MNAPSPHQLLLEILGRKNLIKDKAFAAPPLVGDPSFKIEFIVFSHLGGKLIFLSWQYLRRQFYCTVLGRVVQRFRNLSVKPSIKPSVHLYSLTILSSSEVFPHELQQRLVDSDPKPVKASVDLEGGASVVSAGFGSNNANAHKKRGKALGAPIEGPLLTQGQESELMNGYLVRGTLIVHVVPVYDGREKLKWNTFKDKAYEKTIREGSTVMVLFSVKRGGLGDKEKNMGDLPNDVTFALYLNILAIIVLAEPTEHFGDEPSPEPAKAFGVDVINEFFGEVVDEQSEGGEDDGQYL